jgi:hypothetical protein
LTLAVDDPLAWAGTLAFPYSPPEPSAVTAHVDKLQADGLLLTEQPVLWDFGPSGLKVYWEQIGTLRPYAEDVKAWEAARQKQRKDDNPLLRLMDAL